MSQQVTLEAYLNGKIKTKTLLDFVEKKLIEQGRPASKDGFCMYRGPENTKCGIGHIIPNSKYRSWMDNVDYPMSVGSLIKEATNTGLFNVNPSVVNEKYDLLTKIQNIHDEADGASHFNAYISCSLGTLREEYSYLDK